MSMRFAIEGIGPVGGFGAGKEELWDALENPSGPNGSADVELPEGTTEVPVFRASTDRLSGYVSKRKSRRLGRFSRLALLGSYLALDDAGLLGKIEGEKIGMIVASGYGPTAETFEFLNQINEEGDECVSPTLFSNSAHSVAQSMISIVLGMTGPALTVSEFRMSVPMALVNALQWLREGRVRHVLLGAVDEHCATRLYCHERLYGTESRRRMQALNYHQYSAILGEGAVFLVLSRYDGSAASGCIENVDVGWVDQLSMPSAPDCPVIIGADGHPECGKMYERYLPEDAPLLACTPVYGSLPVGPAFDLAVAALACENGVLPLVEAGFGLDRAGGEVCVTEEGIRCLTLDSKKGYGGFRVRPN